jgi:hypothetical protein
VLFEIGLVSLLLVNAVALAGFVWPADERPAELRSSRNLGTVDDFEPESVTSLHRQDIRAYLMSELNGSFRAYYATDPVYGCPVVCIQREPKFFEPCHGLEYDIDRQPIPGNPLAQDWGC